MTETGLASGTDRVYQAVQTTAGLASDTIVNLQGDEPLMPPAVIAQVVALLGETGADMATLGVAIEDEAQWRNSDVVKVVVGEGRRALYFSRAPIPWGAEGHSMALMRHIGIYAYSAGFLERFVGWGESELEACERLEQLRALYGGASIAIEMASVTVPAGVDNDADLQRVRAVLERVQ